MKRSRSFKSEETNQQYRKTSCNELDDCLFFDCLYGTETTVEESEEFVTNRTREVEQEIDKLSDNMKEAYYAAISEDIKQGIHYVRSQNFLLCFLRAESFDASKAALRMAKFLKYKSNLFGRTMLPRRIRQENLNALDKQILSAGILHFDTVDLGGRLVLFVHVNKLRQYISIPGFTNSLMRVAMYLIMFAIEHNNRWDQSKGVVVVRYGLNSTMPIKIFRCVSPYVKMLIHAFPMKYAAVHIFSNNVLERSCVQWTQMLFPKSVIQKVKSHSGTSAASCLAVLSKYGIDTDALPISINCDFRVEFFQSLLKQMRQMELRTFFDEIDDQSLSTAVINNEKQLEDTNNCYDAAETVEKAPGVALNVQQQPLSRNNIASKHLRHKQSVEKHFPSQLMEILQSNTNPDAIWWSRNGNAFVIEKNKFSTFVLHKKFGGIRYDSFLRRIRRWKFQRLTQKLGSECIEYQHHLFKRNMPQLLEGWNINENDTSTCGSKFPVKLKKVMENNHSLDSIWWVDNGKAFAIDMNKFSSDVLHNNFEGIKVDSFLRMLRKWGFRRISDERKHNTMNEMIFQHNLFQKNLELPSQIVLLDWEYSADVVTTISTKKGEKFPNKLYRILSSEKVKHAIWWLNCGTAFAIQEGAFSCDVLPQEYGAIKISSFKRSLHRWGFRKSYSYESISDETIVYHHPIFQRSSPDLLDHWEETKI